MNCLLVFICEGNQDSVKSDMKTSFKFEIFGELTLGM